MLYIIPVFLGFDDQQDNFSEMVKKTISQLQHFAVENVRTARKFIKWLLPELTIEYLHFFPFGKHAKENDFQNICDLLMKGNSVGLMSESGMPCIADPGSRIVRWCHLNQIKVKPLAGPSSIILALAASGKNGQNFQFRGYLPHQSHERKKIIQWMEREAQKTTQIFMETPYRNQKLLIELLSILNDETELSLACNIQQSDEMIYTMPVSKWKKANISIHKKPCIFIL